MEPRGGKNRIRARKMTQDSARQLHIIYTCSNYREEKKKEEKKKKKKRRKKEELIKLKNLKNK